MLAAEAFRASPASLWKFTYEWSRLRAREIAWHCTTTPKTTSIFILSNQALRLHQVAWVLYRQQSSDSTSVAGPSATLTIPWGQDT
jgi:hypothetical protein